MSQNHPPSEYVTIPNECIIRHVVSYSALVIISCITTNTNIHAADCHARIIHILDILENEEMDFSIVGSAEADFISGKLSYESPVGAALLNHEVGDVVKVDAPDGTFEFKILEINR